MGLVLSLSCNELSLNFFENNGLFYVINCRRGKKVYFNFLKKNSPGSYLAPRISKLGAVAPTWP
jgi:hypothetical protein